MIFADSESLFETMFFIACLFFMAMAIWKNKSGLYLWAGFMGAGFLVYTIDNYTIDSAMAWFLMLFTLGAFVLGFLRR